ncbi:MAG: hypothetical protein ACR2QU_01620, partial [Gammaproteobacteria bacterium]
MAGLSFSDAFGRYGAKPRNAQWAVSAIADDQLVVSCWKQYFESAIGGALPYQDKLSRWGGPGSDLLR